MVFRDRVEAGECLARQLLRRGIHGVVLGVSHHGIPVAHAVARRLGAPLRIVAVQRLFASGSRRPFGAVAETGDVWVDAGATAMAGVGPEEEADLAVRQVAAAAQFGRELRFGCPPASLRGETAVVVDEGASTGCTAQAAVLAARTLGAGRVVVALPVVAPAAAAALREAADELVYVDAPPEFLSVHYWYVQQPQLTDADLRALVCSDAGGGEGRESQGHA